MLKKDKLDREKSAACEVVEFDSVIDPRSFLPDPEGCFPT